MGKIATDATLQELLTLLQTFLNTQQSGLEGKIGTLSTLTTSAKGSLVAAINELVGVDASGRLTALETIAATLGTGGLPLNAYTRNNIYRGKNLGSAPTAEQYAAIKNGTFKDLCIGDYWDNGTFRILIVHFNYFRYVRNWWDYTSDQCGGTNHVVCMVHTTYGGYKTPWKADGDISGAYYGSDARALCLGQVTTDMKAFFGAEHLMYHYDVLPNAANISTGAHTGSITVTDSCVEVPSWKQVLTGLTRSDVTNTGDGYGESNAAIPLTRGQFALFKLRHKNDYYSGSSD